MKCLIIDCEKEASNGFECCSSMHGTILAMARKEIPNNFSANYASQRWGNRQYTIEEALTYVTSK